MEESIKRLLPLGRQRYNAHWCHSLDGKLFQLEAYDAVVEKLTQSLKKSFFFFWLVTWSVPFHIFKQYFAVFSSKVRKDIYHISRYLRFYFLRSLPNAGLAASTQVDCFLRMYLHLKNNMNKVTDNSFIIQFKSYIYDPKGYYKKNTSLAVSVLVLIYIIYICKISFFKYVGLQTVFLQAAYS